MVNWEEIESVFLDMDGTLLDLHFDDHFWQELIPQEYAKKNQISLELSRNRLQPLFQQHEGTLNWYCLDFWSKELNMDIPKLKAEISELIAIHDGVIEFLIAVRKTGRRIALITNAHGAALALKMNVTGLTDHFDNIICAHDIGLPKEQPRFWEKLQSVEPYKVNATLFVDDSIPVLRSAKQAGLTHLLTIQKPSSKKPKRNVNEFVMLDNFMSICPNS